MGDGKVTDQPNERMTDMHETCCECREVANDLSYNLIYANNSLQFGCHSGWRSFFVSCYLRFGVLLFTGRQVLQSDCQAGISLCYRIIPNR